MSEKLEREIERLEELADENIAEMKNWRNTHG